MGITKVFPKRCLMARIHEAIVAPTGCGDRRRDDRPVYTLHYT